MAFSIVTNPPAVTTAYNCIIWEVLITDTGTGDESIKLAYQLEDEDGNKITGVEFMRPPVPGIPIPLDFSEDVQGLVQTLIPQGAITSSLHDENAYIKVRLNIWQVITNTATCDPPTESEKINSPYTTVVNAALQATEMISGNFYVEGVTKAMSYVPELIYQCRESLNYLWVWGSGSAYYEASDGRLATVSFSEKVNVIPFCVRDFYLDYEPITWLRIEVAGKQYRIIFTDCCCSGADYKNILYLSHLGGRFAVSFECIDSLSVSADYDLIRRYKSCKVNPTFNGDDNSLISTGGDTIANKRARKIITLTRQTSKKLDDQAWMESFFGASGYHVQIKLANGNTVWHKFIVESGEYGYYKDSDIGQMVVNGYLSPALNSQTIDR